MHARRPSFCDGSCWNDEPLCGTLRICYSPSHCSCRSDQITSYHISYSHTRLISCLILTQRCHVQALYAQLLEQLRARGLAVHKEDIDPSVESRGVMGHASDYHGFVALTITHAKQ